MPINFPNRALASFQSCRRISVRLTLILRLCKRAELELFLRMQIYKE